MCSSATGSSCCNLLVQEAICQSLDEDQEEQELEEAIRLSLQQQQLSMDKDCSPQLVRFCPLLHVVWHSHLLFARMSHV